MYPALARENNIEGRVLVRFIVTKAGQVHSPEILKSAHSVLAKEAVRVVNTMSGHWMPAIIDDEPTRVYFTLPILFKLTNEE